MSVHRTVARALLLAACAAALAGCAGPYGLHGDKGLPPPPENLQYQTVYAPPGRHDKLKSAAEQKKLQDELLARKRPAGSKRG